MYTQCPECETVFHITMEQLQAHGGMVRCGQCDHVFNADQRLFDDIPQKQAPKSPATPKKARGNTTTGAKPKPVKLKAASTLPAASRKPPRAPRKSAAPIHEEIEAAPAPKRVSSRAESRQRSGRQELDADTSTWRRRPAPRRFSSLWIVGILLWTSILAAQTAYFYRDQLAAYPQWRPYLIGACAEIGCTLRPPYDTGRIELVQPTNIAPHPRYANALRLRATLVNRAEKAQPHPLMQVTLTDSAGRVLSRRTFAPVQYLEHRASVTADMSPHLAIGALLDLANPDGKALGYQIDFFAPYTNAPMSR